MNGQVVGFKLEDGTSLSIAEYMQEKGIIDYSFSNMKGVLNNLKNKAFIDSVLITNGSEGWKVKVLFQRHFDFITFNLNSTGQLTYVNNNSNKLITNWETTDARELAEKYSTLSPTINALNTPIPIEVIIGMFKDLRYIIKQYRDINKVNKLDERED